jgi:hypothetical protein
MSIIYVNPFQFAAAPVGPTDPDFANVSLLLHGDGTNGSTTILDNSPSPKTVTAYGNAQISTAQSKFGGASIAFDGSGDYLTVPSSADFNFGLDDYTKELWVRFNNVGTSQTIAARYQVWPSAVHFYLARTSTSKINYRAGNGTPINLSSVSSVVANVWYHVAITCSSGTTRLFLDGQLEASTSATASLTSTQPMGIGYELRGSEFLNGYIDEFRITKGVARYQSAFPPPTAPFPDA